MSTVVLRSTKGSALTIAEADANINNLNTDKLENITSQSIGNLSDVDISGAADGQVLTYNNSQSRFEPQTLSAGGISNVVEDTSPQLGGNLDMNGSYLVTTSNANVNLAPNGNGYVEIRGNNNAGAIRLNCESNSHGQTIKSQPHSASVTNELLLPAGGNSTLVSEDASQTLKDKTLEDYKETVHAIGSNDSTSISISNGNVQSVTITSGLNLPAFSDAAAGQSVTLIVSGSGNATGTGAYKFAGGNKTLTTESVVSIFYDGTTYYTSIATDFQA